MADLDDNPDFRRPFYDDWPRRHQSAAHALWAWHSELYEAEYPGESTDSESVRAFFREEREQAEAGVPLRLVSDSTCVRAYEVCAEYDLDRDLLGAQAEAAQVFPGETTFETKGDLETFVQLWAVPHARLLAGLVGANDAGKVPLVDELARGFFHLGRLLVLPDDVRRGNLFIPTEELRQYGVSVDQLKTGEMTDGVRRLLWKHSVRIRDALAQGQRLLHLVSFRQHYRLKRWWLGGLAMVDEVERRDFDLWSQPVRLSLFRRASVYLQTVFGRTAAR